ncbi:COG1361 S-layer family protein [Sulfurisphaera javensis]|uniref:COG1361 S-layer family protein n=1 Tax=Sulfurisphaera javensis TaxID=2049879 RepID=A0AAT9GNX9_9CREN
MKFKILNKALGFFVISLFILSLTVFSLPSSYSVNLMAIAHPSQLIAPGMSPVAITYTLINLGSTLFDVNVTPLSVYPFTVYQYYNQTENITIPELQSGNSLNVTFLYKVSPTASDGIYKVYFKVTGELPNGTTVSKNVSATVPILGYVSVSAQSVWGSLSSPLVVSSGENNLPLTIVLVNTGNVIASNVSVILKSTFPVKFEDQIIHVGYLPVGEPVEVTTYASIYPNASEGVYQVPIEIDYFDGSKITTNMTVSVNGYMNFSVSTVWGSINSPITVSSGQTQVPLTFIVRNLGDVNALNVSLDLDSSYPIYFTQKTAYLGIVPAGEYNYVTVTVNVYPNATPGVYYIPVTLQYFQTKTTIYTPILIYSPNITLNAFTVPPQIFPGYYDVELKAIIVNYGEALANNVTVSLSSPFPVISSNQFTIGALPQGVPANTTFLINIPNDTKPGYYYFNFTVNYDGGKYVKSVKIEVYPKANLEIVGVYYPSLTSGASQVPITITIKNVGNATAKNVKAILGSSDVIYPYVSSSNPLMALTASEAYLGDIAPGEEVNVTYVVDVSSGISAGNYSLAVTLLWNQTGGLFPFVQNDKFTVQVSPSALSNLLSQGIIVEVNGTKYTISWIAIIVVVIIIILIVIALALRGRRKH